MTDIGPPIGCLLSIDDSEFDQMVHERIVRRSGLVRDFRTFLDAEEALEFLRTDDRPKVDAILLDINMPRMDGFEFLDAAVRDIGAGFAEVVVMMLTTSLAPRDIARAKATGVVRDYANKPLELEHLERIAGYLSKAIPSD